MAEKNRVKREEINIGRDNDRERERTEKVEERKE